MLKETKAFEATRKKLAPRIKKISLKEAQRLHKSVGRALETAWDAQDDFEDALGEAREGGLASKKLADVLADADCKKAFAQWKKKTEGLGALVSGFQSYCGEAREVAEQLEKLIKDIDKLLKKAKGFQPLLIMKKEVEAEYKDCKAAADVQGKMKPAELLYASSFDRIVEKTLKDAPKGGGEPDFDLGKLMEPKAVVKAHKNARGLAEDIAAATTEATDLAPEDKRGATGILKKAASDMASLKKLATAYQKILKKTPKKDLDEMRKDKEGKKRLAMVDEIIAFFETAESQLAQAAKEVKKAA